MNNKRGGKHCILNYNVDLFLCSHVVISCSQQHNRLFIFSLVDIDVSFNFSPHIQLKESYNRWISHIKFKLARFISASALALGDADVWVGVELRRFARSFLSNISISALLKTENYFETWIVIQSDSKWWSWRCSWWWYNIWQWSRQATVQSVQSSKLHFWSNSRSRVFWRSNILFYTKLFVKTDLQIS